MVVNDINENLTNLYKIIRDRPSVFVQEVMKLPYSEVVFKKFSKDFKSDTIMTDMERAVAYYYVSFGAYRGRMDNPMIRISANADSNMVTTYQKNMKWILQLSRRLQNVEILKRDFRGVLKQYILRMYLFMQIAHIWVRKIIMRMYFQIKTIKIWL